MKGTGRPFRLRLVAFVAPTVLALSALRCIPSGDGFTSGRSGDLDGSSDAQSLIANEAGSADANGEANADAGADAAVGAGEIFASGQSGAFGLARLGSTLYWTTANPACTVCSCPLASCVGAPSILATGAKATAIAALQHVYWITPATAAISYAIDGGTSAQVLSLPGVWTTANSSTAFVIQEDGSMIALEGDPPGATTTFLNFATTAERMSVTDSAVAWTSPSTGIINYCGSEGCDATTSIVASNEQPVAIALDTSILFWTTTDGRIRSIAHNGSAITSPVHDVVTGLAEPCGLAPDDTSPFLYFVSRGTAAGNYLDGVVGKVLKNGGAVTLLAKGQARPANLLVTESQVYWTNEYDGTIRRVAK